VSRGTLSELVEAFTGREVKGEIVVLVDRAAPEAASGEELEAALARALDQMTVKDAVAKVSADLGLPRGQVYKAALKKGQEP
jgi:16S rRNA (cytidine1402-2'-O)-methyltransferase